MYYIMILDFTHFRDLILLQKTEHVRGILRAKYELCHTCNPGLHLAFRTPWGSRFESHFPFTTQSKAGYHNVLPLFIIPKYAAMM